MIKIEETVVRKMQISAGNEDEAIRVASDMYNNCDVVLEPGEVIDVKFSSSESAKKRYIILTGNAYLREGNITFRSENFVNNLILIDSTLPSIFADMLKNCIDGKAKSIKDLTQLCADENICGVKSKYFVLSYYIKKITDLLYAALHGMSFNNTWNGECRSKSVYMFNNGVTFSMYELKAMLDYIYENAYVEITNKVEESERIKYSWQICL